MNYLSKKLKYKLKYEAINSFYGGSKIDTMKDLFNRHFGQNWILTGSDAIQKYLDHFNITDFKFTVNDVDIFYINNESSNITETRFEDYITRQKTPEKSKTFSNGVSSFDITILSSSHSYYEIDGIKLDIPENMLEQYIENIDRGHPSDQIKINALNHIITRLNPNDKKRIELQKKRARHYDDDDEDKLDGTAGRLRFTHIDVNETEKSPKLLGKSGALNFDDLEGSPTKSDATSPRKSLGSSGALNFDDL
jgi:hypothetical protein